ncbi:hypothetical protein IC006_0612 [Sulfuracidifex tepidarius]|uniref:Uncharacterized protein n=1 Tax=Sulfuracidifex tepidarius TaxID=1294262 RepID=A0A510DT43_9CREN|nr:hypothetical protein IC006_0612 [Sulfuracidifex tepidarius]BBG26072.1 hypothetical protein IC007_0577 [Sulfuracidifex tepidarius]
MNLIFNFTNSKRNLHVKDLIILSDESGMELLIK